MNTTDNNDPFDFGAATESEAPKTETETASKLRVLHVPASPVEFKPPKVRSITAEMEALMRNKKHYAEIHPYLKSIAGETPPLNGSPAWDERVCIINIQAMCKANGYTLLASAPLSVLSPAFKRAFKGSTGYTIRQLARQGRQLRLEHKQQEAAKQQQAAE